MQEGFFDEGAFPFQILDLEPATPAHQSRGKENDRIIAFESLQHLRNLLLGITPVLVHPDHEFLQGFDVQQQVVGDALGMRPDLLFYDLQQTQAVKPAQRMVRGKDQPALLRDLFNPLHLDPGSHEFKSTVDEFQPGHTFIPDQEIIDLILMYNSLQVTDQEARHALEQPGIL